MLYNIFNKKKSKNWEASKENKLKIIVDIHEKNSLVISELASQNIDLIIQSLEVGDYLVGDYIIERKTSSDFISSMLNRRLIEQLRNLKNTNKPLIIIENYAELYKPLSNLHPNSLKGFILSILTDWNIPIIFTKDSKETADYLTLLAKKQTKPLVEMSLHGRRPSTKLEQQKYILTSFPGIGPKTAEKLLKEFKTIKNIINVPKTELEKEIGKKAETFKLVD